MFHLAQDYIWGKRWPFHKCRIEAELSRHPGKADALSIPGRGYLYVGNRRSLSSAHRWPNVALRFKARAPRDNTFPGVTRDMFAEHMRDVVMAAFGLIHTINTNVGS